MVQHRGSHELGAQYPGARVTVAVDADLDTDTSAAASGCGSTVGQWLDTFTCTDTYTYNDGTYLRDTIIEITEGPVVSFIDPYDNGSPYASWYPDESPDLVDGMPSWTVSYSEYFPIQGDLPGFTLADAETLLVQAMEQLPTDTPIASQVIAKMITLDPAFDEANATSIALTTTMTAHEQQCLTRENVCPYRTCRPRIFPE